jgi:hypothetical protein
VPFQDFRFGRPRVGRIAEPRPRCNDSRTALSLVGYLSGATGRGKAADLQKTLDPRYEGEDPRYELLPDHGNLRCRMDTIASTPATISDRPKAKLASKSHLGGSSRRSVAV